jgi:hypothetical protein
MKIFGFGKTKSQKQLADMIAHNADIIQRTEGKSRKDAEYLSICTLLDDLSQRSNGSTGWRETMALVQADYPQHLNDVMTYVGWSSGQLKLNSEAEAALKKRHAKGGPITMDQLSGLSEYEIGQIIPAQMSECVNAISERWLYYNEKLKFKPEVRLSEIIEGFAMPMREFVANSYPIVSEAGAETFWLVVFQGIQQTGKPSLAAINAAISELDAKFRSAH